MVALVVQEYNMQYIDISVNASDIATVLNENDLLHFIGTVAGECYLADMQEDKCRQRALNCIKRGHHSPWEHYNITLKCIVDRGISHALVRHRHCAFQQSSTIYHKYNDDLIIIGNDYSDTEKRTFEQIFNTYKDTLKEYLPSRARDILPNCLATNLIITTNIREWMYIMQRRTGPGDSDNMHIFASKLREWFEEHYPIITEEFDAWYVKHPL